MASFFFSALFLVSMVQGLPRHHHKQPPPPNDPENPPPNEITGWQDAQIETITPFVHYAAAAFCSAAAIKDWECGEHCDANKNFTVVKQGGDGDSVQFWYVGYDETLNTIIVAHQGTDTSKLLPVLTDLRISRDRLDPDLFPGVSHHVQAHLGFSQAHAKTAVNIHEAVQWAQSKYATQSVTLVGHSLGAAISLLDSVYLPLVLSQGTVFRSYLFGMPRVGNRPFANYVDQNAHITRFTNRKDPIPIMPGIYMGYVHPKGEVHISKDGQWTSCPGHENKDSLCTDGVLDNVLEGNEQDHNGPYNGVMIECRV